MIISKTDTILFTGDSITDAGRRRPVGEDAKDWLGKGYVKDIASMMMAWEPEHQRRIQNTGIAGNTVLDLHQRWQEDVLDLHPDWLSVMVGINDCSRSFHRPLVTEGLVSPDTYRVTLRELVATTRASLKGMVLMTPFYLNSSFQDPLRSALQKYAEAIRELAEEYDCVLVDTQAVFDKALQHVHASRLSDDSIHPKPAGHMILAKAWLNAVDFQWQPSVEG